ncbi:MAG: hypothetical protein MRJ65_01870 [Candidatus Brocadiaceae bacterium]|nr:hypothetical protein [Candidatus Brocadiaceae bacterium]
MSEKRISINIPMPSISLKRFIEKAVKEDDFFYFALENPLGSMKECGVNLNASSFIPDDFAKFFAALANVREFVKQKCIKDITFENIFGKEALMSGASLNAQITRGFMKEWDLKQAAFQQMKCFSANQSFESDRERGMTSAKELCQTQEVRVEQQFLGQTSSQSETFRSQNTQWDNADAVQNRMRETGTTRNFEKDGTRTMEDLLSGPLIHPEDLIAISARMDTYLKIRNDNDI